MPAERYVMRTRGKVRFLALVAGGALLFGHSSAASAGELEEACEYVYLTLKTVAGAEVVKRMGTFSFNDRTYSGCVITLDGDSTKGMEAYGPPALLHPSQDNPPYNSGWRRDRESDADGPNGTAFRMLRGKVFCHVEGIWDGGEDDHPEYVPSPIYKTVVQCALTEE